MKCGNCGHEREAHKDSGGVLLCYDADGKGGLCPCPGFAPPAEAVNEGDETRVEPKATYKLHAPLKFVGKQPAAPPPADVSEPCICPDASHLTSAECSDWRQQAAMEAEACQWLEETDTEKMDAIAVMAAFAVDQVAALARSRSDAVCSNCGHSNDPLWAEKAEFEQRRKDEKEAK